MDVYAKLEAVNGKTMTEALSGFLDKSGTGNRALDFLAGGALKLFGAMSDKTANSLLDLVKPKMTDLLNRYLTKRGIPAKGQVIGTVRTGDVLLVTARLTDVDYAALTAQYLPELIRLQKQQYPDDLATEIVTALDDEADNAVIASLNAVSEEKKGKVISLCVRRDQELLCGRLTNALKSRGFDLAVQELEVG